MAQARSRSDQDNSVDVAGIFIQDGKSRVEQFLAFEIDKSPFWKKDFDVNTQYKYINSIVNWQKQFNGEPFDDARLEIETIFIKSMSNDEDVGVQTEEEINSIRGTIKDASIQGTHSTMTVVQKRELETKNMLKGWNFFFTLYKTNGGKTLLTQETIKNGHRILMEGLLTNAGELSEIKRRTECPTTNKIINYPSPEFIKSRFDTFVDYANQINSYLDSEIRERGLSGEIVQLSVKFHAWFFISFIRLHAFSDGNGRLSRLLHAYLQLPICPAPVGIYNIFSKTSKSDYIRVIVEVRKQHEEHECEEHWCFNSKPLALSAMILECLYYTCREIEGVNSSPL